MVEEAQGRIEEMPAAHKARTQKYLVLVGLAVLVALAFAVYIQSSSRKAKLADAQAALEAREQQKAADALLKKPKSATASFDDQLAERQAQVLQAARAAALEAAIDKAGQGGAGADPGTEAALLRLQQQRDAARRGAGYREPAGNSAPEKDLVSEWRKREQLRALSSSVRAYDIAAGKVATVATEPMPRQSALDDQQRDVQQRLAAVQRAKAQLESGAAPEAVLAQIRTGSAGGSTAEGAPAASRSSSSPAQVIGFTEDNAPTYSETVAGKSLLSTGTVISAVLAQQLVSDYTGSFKATITHDVYDPNDEIILIPKGSTITGKVMRIKNVNEPIQARMGLVVNWCVLPNGRGRIDMRKNASVEDQAGVGAIPGPVNYHFMAQFLGVAAYAVLASETDRASSSQFTGDVNIEGDIDRSMRQQFAPLAARYLTLVPTISPPAGTPLKIFIEDDIYLKPWGSIYDRLLSAGL